MKTMTCEQLGGRLRPRAHRGETADDVIKQQDQHLREAVRAGDAAHEPAHDDDEGPLEAPDQGHGLVQGHQASLRRASR